MTLPYLGSILPIEVLMKSLELKYLNSLTFGQQAMSSIIKIGEYKGMQELFYMQSPEALKFLVENAKIESTESSNRIEGITAPHNRIEKIILAGSAPRTRSEQEIAGYRDGLNLIHEVGKNMPFSINVILQLHNMLYRYMGMEGGRWKNGDNEITEKRPDGTVRVRFKPVSAFDTSRYMDGLVENYKNAIEREHREPLVVIPLAIFDFLAIHPFTDGNGRTGRLLTLLLMYHFGFEVGRYISLERIVEESKETYYDALEKSSAGWHEGKHNIHPWLEYFWGIVIRAYKEFEDRVGVVTDEKSSKTDLIRSSVSKKTEPFSISDIEKECLSAGRDMIRLVLRQMRDEGTIKSTGKGRSAKWIRIKEK